MTPTEIIGAVAATLTTIAFVPQAHKVLVHKDTHSLSLGMYLIFTTGVLLWGAVRLPARRLGDHHVTRSPRCCASRS